MNISTKSMFNETYLYLSEQNNNLIKSNEKNHSLNVNDKIKPNTSKESYYEIASHFWNYIYK